MGNNNATIASRTRAYADTEAVYGLQVISKGLEYVDMILDVMEAGLDAKLDFIEKYYEDVERCTDLDKPVAMNEVYETLCMSDKDAFVYGLLAKQLKELGKDTVAVASMAQSRNPSSERINELARSVYRMTSA